MSRRSIPTMLVAVLAVLVAGVPAHAEPRDGRPWPARFALPDGFQPEGIATGPGPFAYFGSRDDGDIYRADLRTGTGEVVSRGPGTPSVGLQTDRKGRLFVAGGAGGDARVVDTRSGKVLASYRLAGADADTFVNDVTLTRNAAWFTDSLRPVLYKVPLRDGRLPRQRDVTEVPISGDFEYVDGFNANGLVPTRDGRGLLVVQSETGKLFRVDRRSGTSTEVDLHGEELTGGDGMLWSSGRLYVVQNRTNRLAVLRVDRSATSARVTARRTHRTFAVPTTVARFGHRLYLPNARLDTEADPTTEYWVTALPVRATPDTANS